MLPRQHPDRKPLRLKQYDYATAGAYYITLCVKNRECHFGEVLEGEMVLNDPGRMVQKVWEELPEHYPHLVLDAFVIMPNHVHGVIVIDTPVGAAPCGGPDITQFGPPQGAAPTQKMSLPDICHRFKSFSTAQYRLGVKQNGWTPFEGKLWQRGYYDHIIRNDSDLFRIRDYIQHNPLNWELDSENPKNGTKQP